MRFWGAPAEGNLSCSRRGLTSLCERFMLPLEGKPACLFHPEQDRARLLTQFGAAPAQLPPENISWSKQWVSGTFETRGTARERCLLQLQYLFVINPALQGEEAAASQGQGKTSRRVYKQEIPVSKVTVKIILPSPNIPEQEILSSYWHN